MRRSGSVVAPFLGMSLGIVLGLALEGGAARALAQGIDLPDLDADAPRRVPLTREDVLRQHPVDPRALASADPTMRWLAARVAAGSTDVRVLRAYHRLFVRLYPFDRVPPADQRLSALAARRRLEADAASAALPLNGCWLPLGPRNIPGRMTAVALHPTDPSTIYAGGAQGGVWKTTDLGATWAPLGDFEATLAIGAVAIDPVDPDVIYAGTGEGNYSGDSRWGVGLLKSGDGGATWTLLPRFTGAFHELHIDPRDRTRLWAATIDGLFLSTDGGNTWNRPGGGLPAGDATSVVLSSGAPGVMLAGVYDGSGATSLWRSTDGGATWAVVPSLTASPDNRRLVVAQSKGNPARLYAAVEDGTSGGLKAAFRSDDEGATWVETAIPGQICNSYCWYCLTVAADPVDPDLAYLGGVGIYKTTDGGGSWSRAANSGAGTYVHADQHHLLTPAADALWSANDGGVNFTRDRGAQWTYVGFPLETAQYYHLSSDRTDDTWSIAGAQDQGTQRFAGSWSWSGILGADGAYTAIDWNDPRVYYASWQGLGLSRSRDRGNGMQRIGGGISGSDPRAFIAPFSLDRSEPRTLFAGTDRLWKSTDQGDSFSAISPTLGGPVVSAIDNCRDVPASIWVGAGGRLWHTPDGGSSWFDRSAGLPGRYVTSIAAHPGLPDTAYVSLGGSGGGHVFRTTDAGVGWSDVSNGLPDIGFNHVLLLEDTPSTLVAASDLGVYVSTDSAASWAVLGQDLPNVEVDWLAYSPSSGTLRAATHGRGAWQLALPGTCPLGPDFAGLESVTTSAATGCIPELAWSAGRATCQLAPGLTYAVYRSTDPVFLPSAATLVAAGLTTTGYRDLAAAPGTSYYYAVKAEDGQGTFGGPANGGRLDVNRTVLHSVTGDPTAGGEFRDDGGDSGAWLASSYWSVGDDGNSTPAGRFDWQSAPSGSGYHDADVCASLETPDLRLGPGATLEYQASFNLEQGWDGVVVEISSDGGASWTDLPPAPGYPGDFSETYGNACGFDRSKLAFSGPPLNPGLTPFAPYASDLSAWAGQDVRIRWRLSSDGGVELEGFRLDDVRVAPVVPAAAPALGNVLLAAKRGPGLRFEWTALPSLPSYRLWHALLPDMAARDRVGEAADTSPYLDDATPRPEPLHFFRVHAVVDCGAEGP